MPPQAKLPHRQVIIIPSPQAEGTNHSPQAAFFMENLFMPAEREGGDSMIPADLHSLKPNM